RSRRDAQSSHGTEADMGKQPDQDENQRPRRWRPCLKGRTLYGRLGAGASPPDRGAVGPAS
ncbi:hypothetical protein P7K49_040274, partial [Saguinus oedipus]